MRRGRRVHRPDGPQRVSCRLVAHSDQLEGTAALKCETKTNPNCNQSNHMKNIKSLIIVTLLGTAATLVLTASRTPVRPSQIERGKYLVGFGGCSDCHTPLKMTHKGPAPDLA